LYIPKVAKIGLNRFVFPHPDTGIPVPYRLDVPETFHPVATYGLRMLLLPFRLVGQEVADFTAPTGVYYGSDPDSAPDSWIRIGMLPGTPRVFLDRERIQTNGLRRVQVEETGMPVLFEATGDLSFDPVAATAYMLGGFHEWATKERDEHGRMPDALTVPVETGTEATPMVEYLRLVIGSQLMKKGVKVVRRVYGSAAWGVCPTHDIDYGRKWRPGIFYREIVERGLLGQASESMAKRASRMGDAVRGLLQPGDPYRNALERMRTETVGLGGTGTYFFKAAARGSRDVSYDLDDPFIAEQIDALLHAGCEVGLHPAYHSWNHPRYIREERDRLEQASGRPLASVRTHYLRWQHPETARLMSGSGFSIDSTLGFSTREGFRAGTCLPYPLFDPEQRTELPLWEVPLACMESALFNRRGLSTEAAIDATRVLMRVCQRFGGVFVGLWHNTLWDEQDCPGWGEHFLWTLDDAATHEAAIRSLSQTLAAWD